MTYSGRFAPTPSGPLHAGSLFTALASWLAARAAGGRWQVRIDDLDTPRCPPGMDAVILRQLEAHGLIWDAAPDYQSEHLPEYEAALQHLQAQGALYACYCTRAVLASTQLQGPDGPEYANTCRALDLPMNGAALRYALPAGAHQFNDLYLGPITRQAGEMGDFAVRRADGQVGYQLACCVDEARMGITAVVRGHDLLGSSLRQQRLMAALGMLQPSYTHLPLVLAADGRKLSKQNGAAGIDNASASANLVDTLERLGLPPPADLRGAPAAELLAWAVGASPALPWIKAKN